MYMVACVANFIAATELFKHDLIQLNAIHYICVPGCCVEFTLS